jgi:hypothetical protein
MESNGGQRVAIEFYFKAGKTATETVQMGRAAHGDEALGQSNIFCWNGFVKDRKLLKTTPGVVAPLSLKRTVTSEMFGSCCCKIVTYHFE